MSLLTGLSGSGQVLYTVLCNSLCRYFRRTVGSVIKMPEMLSQLWLVPIKDLIMTGVWFASLLSNNVMWAGRKFKMIRGGAMQEVKS